MTLGMHANMQFVKYAYISWHKIYLCLITAFNVNCTSCLAIGDKTKACPCDSHALYGAACQKDVLAQLYSLDWQHITVCKHGLATTVQEMLLLQ